MSLCECGDHAWMVLTQGFVALVSPEDEHLTERKWHVNYIRARCSAQHRKSLDIESALGGGQAISNVSASTADPGLPGNLPAFAFRSAANLPSPSSGGVARALSDYPVTRLGPFSRHAGTYSRGTNLTGSLSRWSFRTLLQSFQESSCVQFILCRPEPIPFVAAAHVSNVAKVSCHERQVACKG